MKLGSFLLSACAVALGVHTAAADWPQWRGPEFNGVASGATPPTIWSESSNVKWKVKLPGFGTSTPIVWKNKVFVTSAVSTGKTGDGSPVAARPSEQVAPPAAPGDGPPRGERRRREGGGPGGFPGGPGGGGRGRGEAPTEVHQFILLCLDLDSGKTLWEKVASEVVPHEGHHRDHGFASHSAVTDGGMVYAYFGSRGLHAFTLSGEKKWSKDLGKMLTRNAFGEGSSPLLYGDAIVVNWDHEGEDFIAVFDKRTGEERWRKQRDEPTTWSTPIGVKVGGVDQIIVSATNRIRGYNLANGDLIWECGGMTVNVIPTPIVGHDMVFAISGFRGNALRAIKLGKTGDLTDTDAVAWSYDTKCSYVPSALLSGERIWFFSQNSDLLSCLDAKTGKVLIDAHRVEPLSGVYASPIAADGRIYLIGRNGEGVVIKDAPAYEELASNKLDDKFDASPVAVGKSLLLRGHQNLYCLAEK
ncbi:MAG: PQQ-binding-like beta-propeller repeat protein [Verrucomicrobiales bacterium]